MKNLSRPQYYRIRRILELIREGTRTGMYPNARDFTEELGVSWRTAMRDLDFLRDEENAPVEYAAERHGYRLSDETWELPAVRLSSREVFAFWIAQKVLKGFRGTPLEMDMRSVLEKIGESLEGTVTLDLGSVTDRLSVVGEDYARIDPDIWKTVAGAVERREKGEVTYQRFDGTVKRYVLAPFHLVAYHGNWYVLAREEAENGSQRPEVRGSGREQERIATFAVSRIRQWTKTGDSFELPQGFDAETHLRRAFGIAGGGEAFDVRLAFSRKVAAYVRERVWHPDQQIRERKDGGIELRFRTAGWKELVRWVLSWQPDVTVLKPRALRERVREKMRQGLKGTWHDGE